ncbi:MAG: cation diffusion facilitator family transporter [Gaiellales bacterium]
MPAPFPSDAPRSKRNAAWLSVALTGSSVAVKGAVAIATGSSAILAETAHSFSDLLAASIALIAIRAADRPPDPTHPFGHQKLEHVSAVVEGLILIVVAGLVVLQSARSFGDPVENSTLGIVVMAVSAGASFLVARHVSRVARQAHSAALEADSAHLAADVWSSIGTAAALVVIALTGWVEVDAIFGIAVSAWVAATGGRLVLNGLRVLVDETVSQDDLDAIRDALESSKPAGVISYHRLRARRSGAVRHVDVHVVVDPQMTVAAAHVITDEIEASLEARLPSADVVVHVEPAGSEPEADAHY